MPRKRDPNSKTSKVLAWYQAHPGVHRPCDVGRALGLSTQDVSLISAYLWERGDILRDMVSTSPRRSEYGVADPSWEHPIHDFPGWDYSRSG